MNKKNIFIFLLLTQIPLLADFFSIRKMVNSEKKQTVYLLYDAHATIVTDKEIVKNSEKKLEQIINRKDAPKEGFNKFPNQIKELQSEAINYLKGLNNLTTQRENLVEVIKQYNLSAIIEDWPKGQIPTNFLHISRRKETLITIKDFLVGKGKSAYNQELFKTNATPMLYMGKILTGKFKTLKIQKIKNTTGYYYNPDNRTSKWLESDTTVKKVDTYTLDALKKFFTNHNQKHVVIAEGFWHIVNIIDDLQKDNFKTKKMILSPGLEKIASIDSPTLKQFITALKENNIEQVRSIQKNFKNKETYFLVKEPIDIKAFFDSKFKPLVQKKKESKPTDTTSLTKLSQTLSELSSIA